MPETWMARHVIGLNHVSIGIENVGGARDRDDLTHDQLKANEYIVRYLKEKYPSIEYLIGHYEYTLFDHHPLWKERDSTYRTEKTDPGVRFMTLLRERVSDLGLKGR
jgi:N-acetyl-anhydromuramyl-L-alanine amidase AmpD